MFKNECLPLIKVALMHFGQIYDESYMLGKVILYLLFVERLKEGQCGLPSATVC